MSLLPDTSSIANEAFYQAAAQENEPPSDSGPANGFLPITTTDTSSDRSSTSSALCCSDSEMPPIENNWTTSSRKRCKKSSIASSGDTVINTTPSMDALTVVIKPVDGDHLITKVNPLKLREKLQGFAPDGVTEVRPNPRLNLLAVDTRNMESTKALLTITSIGGIPVRVYQPHSKDSAVGVIHGVSKDIPDEELQQVLCSIAPLRSSRRLGQSETVKLVFNTTRSPEYVVLGHTRFKVLPFIEKPLQCRKCFNFGHVGGACTKRQLCPRCGGPHSREICDADHPQCVNCGNHHESTSISCPEYKKEESIHKLKNEAKMDYLSAKKAIGTGVSSEETNQRPGPSKSITLSSASPGATSHSTAVRKLDQNPRREAPKPTDSYAGRLHDTSEFPPLSTRAQTDPGTPLSASSRQISQTTERFQKPVTPTKEKKECEENSENPAQPGSTSSAAKSIISCVAIKIRSFLSALSLPWCEAAISIIDAILPFILLWC